MTQTAVRVDSGIPASKFPTMTRKPVLLPFGKTIYQTSQGQAISSDHTFLVELINSRTANDHLSMMDLGCGNGILSIMLAYYRPNWQITGLEIQPHLAQLARANCELTGFSNIKIREQDLREYNEYVSYDLILSNPPYFPENSGRLSPVREKAISTHELNCNMMDILSFFKKYLKRTGEAYLIYPSERLGELEKYAKKVDLNIKAEFFFNVIKKKKVIFLLTQR